MPSLSLLLTSISTLKGFNDLIPHCVNDHREYEIMTHPLQKIIGWCKELAVVSYVKPLSMFKEKDLRIKIKVVFCLD